MYYLIVAYLFGSLVGSYYVGRWYLGPLLSLFYRKQQNSPPFPSFYPDTHTNIPLPFSSSVLSVPVRRLVMNSLS